MVDDLLYIVSFLSALLPLLAGITVFKFLEAHSGIWLILLAIAFVTQLKTWLVISAASRWRDLDLYSIIDAGVWSNIFFRNSNNSVNTVAITTVFVLQVFVVSVAVLSTVFSDRFVYSNTFSPPYFICEKYKTPALQQLQKAPNCWFYPGLLTYCGTSCCLFACYSVVNYANRDYADLRALHSLVTACLFIIFSTAVFVNINRTSKA